MNRIQRLMQAEGFRLMNQGNGGGSGGQQGGSGGGSGSGSGEGGQGGEGGGEGDGGGDAGAERLAKLEQQVSELGNSLKSTTEALKALTAAGGQNGQHGRNGRNGQGGGAGGQQGGRGAGAGQGNLGQGGDGGNDALNAVLERLDSLQSRLDAEETAKAKAGAIAAAKKELGEEFEFNDALIERAVKYIPAGEDMATEIKAIVKDASSKKVLKGAPRVNGGQPSGGAGKGEGGGKPSLGQLYRENPEAYHTQMAEQRKNIPFFQQN